MYTENSLQSPILILMKHALIKQYFISIRFFRNSSFILQIDYSILLCLALCEFWRILVFDNFVKKFYVKNYVF